MASPAPTRAPRPHDSDVMATMPAHAPVIRASFPPETVAHSLEIRCDKHRLPVRCLSPCHAREGRDPHPLFLYLRLCPLARDLLR
jgi:hypothetical protein